MILAAWFIYSSHAQPVTFIASTFLLLICFTDTLYTRIPNLLNLALLITGTVYNTYLGGPQGFALALLGALTGFALFILPYALGMGAGDVKALAALGALLGPTAIFQVFLYIALTGGILAIAYYCFTTNLRQQSLAGIDALKMFIYTRDLQNLRPTANRDRTAFPYATAIALGFFAYIRWGPIVSLLLGTET